MPVRRAVRRTIKDAPTVVDRRQRTTFAAHKRVSREALREHAVEAHERALGVVAPEGVQRVTSAVERINAMLAGPEIELVPTGSHHAHEDSAVLFLKTRNPILLRTSRREDSAADGVADDDVPIAADAA